MLFTFLAIFLLGNPIIRTRNRDQDGVITIQAPRFPGGLLCIIALLTTSDAVDVLSK